MEYPARRQSSETNPRRRESSLADVRVGWIVAWLILGTMAVLFINDLRGVSKTTSDEWPVLIVNAVILAWIIRQVRRHRLRLPDLFGSPPQSFRDLVPMLAGPCFLVASLAITSLFAVAVLPGELLESRRSDVVTAFLPTTATPGRLALAVTTLLFTAPVIEELLFRRILLSRWPRAFGAP